MSLDGELEVERFLLVGTVAYSLTELRSWATSCLLLNDALPRGDVELGGLNANGWR